MLRLYVERLEALGASRLVERLEALGASRHQYPKQSSNNETKKLTLSTGIYSNRHRKPPHWSTHAKNQRAQAAKPTGISTPAETPGKKTTTTPPNPPPAATVA